VDAAWENYGKVAETFPLMPGNSRVRLVPPRSKRRREVKIARALAACAACAHEAQFGK
jgi:hypothetical protein